MSHVSYPCEAGCISDILTKAKERAKMLAHGMIAVGDAENGDTAFIYKRTDDVAVLEQEAGFLIDVIAYHTLTALNSSRALSDMMYGFADKYKIPHSTILSVYTETEKKERQIQEKEFPYAFDKVNQNDD